MLGACLYTLMGHTDGEAPAAGDSRQLAKNRIRREGRPERPGPTSRLGPASSNTRQTAAKAQQPQQERAVWLCSVPTVGPPERDFSS